MGSNGKNIRGVKNPNYKTGLAIAGKRSSLYTSWQNMKSRCLRNTNPKYKRYGGRGISICEDWLSIQGFANWAYANGWEEGLQIDRIDNDGNYEPSNCRWVTASENARKKSTTKISFDEAKEIRRRIDSGENEFAIAKEFNVQHGTIWFIKNNFTHVAAGEHTKAKALNSKKHANDNRKS